MAGKIPEVSCLRPVAQKVAGAGKKIDFNKIYREELERQQELTFSMHAEKRLKERNITLNKADLDKINGAVKKAADKGSRDVLILYGGLALITSIKNKTVITALDEQSLREHVFTNIDSAVILK